MEPLSQRQKKSAAKRARDLRKMAENSGLTIEECQALHRRGQRYCCRCRKWNRRRCPVCFAEYRRRWRALRMYGSSLSLYD